MSNILQWCACPKCDIVQPVLESWWDDGGYEMTYCRWCETTEGAPYQYDVNGWCHEPNKDDIEELFKKLGVI